MELTRDPCLDKRGVHKLTGTKFQEYMEEELKTLEETQQSLLPSWKAEEPKTLHDRIKGKA